jgi:hypothetical protein
LEKRRQKWPPLFFVTLPIKKAAFFITNFDRFTNYTMKYLLAIVSLTLLLFSCKNQDEEYHKPESALDAGREFIQQSLKGKFVLANKYMLQEVKCGDLAFFDNEAGKIIHVGILLDSEAIIHASGKVRIDTIDNLGIINGDTGKRTHKLRVIKRIVQ